MDSYQAVKKSLKLFLLPPLVSYKDIKVQYRVLSKKYHPDVWEDDNKMIEINIAYRVLLDYAENFKFTFSQEEINKQFPQESHDKQFGF